MDRVKNSFKKHMKWYLSGITLVIIMVGAFFGYRAFVSAADEYSFNIRISREFTSNPSSTAAASVHEETVFPDDFGKGKDYANMTWLSSEEYPVFAFRNGNDTGSMVELTALGAGTSDLYAHYFDHYYVDENTGQVIDPDNLKDQDIINYKEVKVDVYSTNILSVKVPLRMEAAVNNGTISKDTVVTENDSVLISYNAFAYEDPIDGVTYPGNHVVDFTYNPSVLNGFAPTLVPGGTSTKNFTVIGGGATTIRATVDGEVYILPYKLYSKVEFTDKTTIEIKQNAVKALSNAETNILNDNFGYVDADGNHSVYFWTLEDYRRANGETTGIVTVVEVSESGVITGKYAGETTLYASCKPMSESYNSNGTLDTSVADSVQVKVPYEPYFSDGVIVSVGDTIPILTSGFEGNTNYTVYNPDNVIMQLESDGAGIYHAIKAGTAKVTVTVGYYVNGVEHFTDPVDVIITVIDKLTLNKVTDSVNIGNTTTVTAVPTCTDTSICTNVRWISSDESIATVTYDDSSFESCLNATITGISKGTTTITCMQTVNGVVKIATMTITVTVPVDGITLSEPQPGRDHLTMYLGQTTTIYAYLKYDHNDVPDNTELIWTVSGEQLITLNPVETTGVTQSCEVTATGLGQTTVTVYSKDNNQIVTCDIFVTEQPLSITLSDTHVLAAMSMQQYQLKGTVESANGGADQTIIWSTLNPDVCTVDPDTGLVTLVAPGNTYICATSAVDSSVVAYCYFEVAQDVYGILLDKTELTLDVGDTYRLTASVNPADAFDKTMVWTSSNPSVIAVEDTDAYENLLTAVGSGSATIFAETNDGGYIAYCNVKVLQPATGIEMSNTEMTVRKGTEFYLNAKILPETADDKTIVWSSNDDNIATVSNDGKVITVAVGQCIITATNPNTGVSASCTVNVLEPITGLTLNTYYQNMVKDTKFVLVPNIEPVTASNKNVTFWSSDEDVATVDERGVVTAVNGGVCEIVVTTEESSFTAKCIIAVKEYVSSITLTDEFRYLNYGASYEMSADVGAKTATDKTLIWSSSNSSVVSVTDKGVITGVNYGTAVITATAADGSGVSASCIVQVIRPVSLITLDKSKVTIYVGDVIHITATVSPADASVKKVSWTSSDPTIARVYDDGDVEGVSVGRCKIYAMSTDGNNIVAECTVIVQQVINATSISVNSHDILMLTGKTRKLTARMYPLNSSETVKWLSTDTSVVVVDSTGQITTVGPGQCEVVAYTTYGSVEDRCTVYSMAISKSSLTLEQYDTFNLYVDGAPSAASWRSSNPRIATVTQGGIVTGRMPGECTISATVDGKTVTCYVTVRSIDPDKFINKINQ